MPTMRVSACLRVFLGGPARRLDTTTATSKTGGGSSWTIRNQDVTGSIPVRSTDSRHNGIPAADRSSSCGLLPSATSERHYSLRASGLPLRHMCYKPERGAEHAQLAHRLEQGREEFGRPQARATAKGRRPQSFLSECESREHSIDAIEVIAFPGICGKEISDFAS
jgi:hypothetical protein